MGSKDRARQQNFSLFFDAYKEQVYGYVLAIVKQPDAAEELTQDIFIKLWSAADLLDDIQHVDRYLYVLSRNRALNHLRKLKTDRQALGELRKQLSERDDQLENHLLDLDYQRLLSDALGLLSEQRRTVYLLSREEGLSMNEIADRLRLSPNTVKNHLVAALKGIREHLARHTDLATLLIVFSLI